MYCCRIKLLLEKEAYSKESYRQPTGIKDYHCIKNKTKQENDKEIRLVTTPRQIIFLQVIYSTYNAAMWQCLQCLVS